jgi:hypothetical protein
MKAATYLALAMTAISMVGCRGGDDESRIPISGIVQLDGKPLTGASLAFIAGGGSVLSTATTDKEGKFTAKVGAGTNKVGVSKIDADLTAPAPTNDEDSLMGTEAEVKAQAIKQPKSLVPERYANPNMSGLSFDIVNGMAPIQIELGSK